MSSFQGFRSKRQILACAITLASSQLSLAETDTKVEQATGPVETMVVVGSTTNVDIEGVDLQVRQANDLEDVFRTTPSVSVGGSIGLAQKVYIRGLEDTLLNITVDGAPQTGTLFHHIGRVNIEPELLETVELQAGAGEATSGFGAIGGAIRFRTVDANDLLDANQDFGGIFKVGYFDNDGTKSSQTVYGRFNEHWSILGSQVEVRRDEMVDGDDETIFGSGANQSLTFVKASGNFEGLHSFDISHERRVETGQVALRPNWPALASEDLVNGEGERETVVANYQYTPSKLLNLEITAYDTKTEFNRDHPRFGYYRSNIETIGFDLRNTSFAGNHKIVYGVEHRNDNVKGAYITFPDFGSWEEEGDLLGVYIQNQFQLSDPLLLSFGLRYDSYELEQITLVDETDSSGVSINIGALYEFTDNLSLTVGYAEALRGKEIGDGFTLEQFPAGDSIADDLEAETVENVEIGIEFDNNQVRAGISYYDMVINDVILDQLGNGTGITDSATQANTYYENIGDLKADGFELNTGYSWSKVDLDLYYVTSDTKLNDELVEGYEHIGLANSTGDTWTLDLQYHPSNNSTIGFNIRHVEALNDIQVLHRSLLVDSDVTSLQEIDKPSYTVSDFYISFKILEDDAMTINVAIQNIFNETYLDHSSVGDYTNIPLFGSIRGVNEAGRDVRLNASYQF